MEPQAFAHSQAHSQASTQCGVQHSTRSSDYGSRPKPARCRESAFKGFRGERRKTCGCERPSSEPHIISLSVWRSSLQLSRASNPYRSRYVVQVLVATQKTGSRKKVYLSTSCAVRIFRFSHPGIMEGRFRKQHYMDATHLSSSVAAK